MRTRDALAAGVSRATLAGPRWRPISHGLHVPHHAPDDRAARSRQIRAVLPDDAVLSHLTAARLWSLWLPRLPEWLPMTATLPPGVIRPERRGLYVARSRAALPTPRLVAGVPVVPPEVVLGQLAEDLSLVDLVVAIDSALALRLCTRAQVIGAVRRRQRGLPRLRRALELCDPRSESPWETVLRLVHVLAGIPVVSQYAVHDDTGVFLARADLRVEGTHRLPEYDGAPHRQREQHERDLARDKLLSRHGWQRYGYTASELLSDPASVIRDAEQALGRGHDPSRVVGWLEEAERSSLTAAGRRRLWRRLHRFDRPLRGRGERRTAAAPLRTSA